MLFEFPKVHIASLKDFAKHYLMIVLSILTALGLEAWIEHAHHQRAAVTAGAQIEMEIRTNLTEDRTSLQKDVAQLKRLDAIREAVTEDLKAHVPDDVIKQHILAQTRDHFDLNLNFPTLRHEAWDVVVANQSASWIDHDRMQRYSAAYASQRDVITAMSENTALLMNGTGLVDTIADLGTGDVQPREFLHVISQMAAIHGQTVNNLRMLEKQLEAALPGETSNTTKPAPAA
jgi:hypothetical protein